MKISHINDFKGGHIHFIGIGGISMSALAEILLLKGYRVTGSDMVDKPILRHLKQQGATVFIGHQAENIGNADLVVHTAAVKEDNPEMIEARKRGIPVLDRATLLGQIMQSFQYAIAVSGSHGKTTATSILSSILIGAKLDPTVLVGGELDSIGGNVRTGKSSFFITEACEYVESFLRFYPYMAIILNIDEDHLDYFRDIDHIYQAFLKFAKLVPRKGYLVGCADDPLVRQIMNEVDCHIVEFGINDSKDWKAQDIKFDSRGCASYRASYRGQDMGLFSLQVPGQHNIYNALAATAASWASGVSLEVIRDSLHSYTGTHRRFEVKGEVNGVTVIDDYAHHPTEIRATLNAAQNLPHKKVWCIFQPHTYTRTRKLFEHFVNSFVDADELIITDIYAAREKNTGEIHSRDLAKAIAHKVQSCTYIETFQDIVRHLEQKMQPGDLVITMGAGDIHKVGEMLLLKA